MASRGLCLVLSLLAEVVLIGLLLLGPGLSVIVLGESSGENERTINQGQIGARAALEAHRAVHRRQFTEVVQFMPVYSITSGDRTSVFLLSLFADPIQVKMTVYDSQGRPFPLIEHRLEPRTHFELSLNQALASAPPGFSQGSLCLEYRGEASTLLAWAVLRRGSHATEVPFRVAGQFKSTILRSFWDRLPLDKDFDAIPTYYLVNTTAGPIEYSTSIENGERKSTGQDHSLGPRSWEVITVPHHLKKGSLVIRHGGLPGDLMCAGFLQGQTVISPLPVVDPAMPESGRRHALRVKSSQQWTTWLTIANPTPTSQTATLSVFDPISGKRLVGKKQRVAAGKLKTVKLAALLDRTDGLSGLHRLIGRAVARLLGRDKAHFPEIVRIIFDHEDAPGSLLVSGTSVSRAGQVASVHWFQDARAHHNGIYPVPNGSLGEVFVTLLNLGDAPANVVAQFNWDKGGAYALPPITVDPGRTYRLDFAELVEKAKPDVLNRVIDSTYQRGFFSWSARGGNRKLLGRTEVRTVDGGHFGFTGTGCCVEYPFGRIEPRKFLFVVGSTISVVACEYRETCSAGLLGPFYALSPSLTVSPPFIWDGLTLGASGPGSGDVSFTSNTNRYELMNTTCMSSAAELTK